MSKNASMKLLLSTSLFFVLPFLCWFFLCLYTLINLLLLLELTTETSSEVFGVINNDGLPASMVPLCHLWSSSTILLAKDTFYFPQNGRLTFHFIYIICFYIVTVRMPSFLASNLGSFLPHYDRCLSTFTGLVSVISSHRWVCSVIHKRIDILWFAW